MARPSSGILTPTARGGLYSPNATSVTSLASMKLDARLRRLERIVQESNPDTPGHRDVLALRAFLGLPHRPDNIVATLEAIGPSPLRDYCLAHASEAGPS